MEGQVGEEELLRGEVFYVREVGDDERGGRSCIKQSNQTGV